MIKNTQAFTLIELSIVVVIIGLIVAGVVAGQSLVHQAKLRSIISDKEKYITSFNTFMLQYNAVPGDMINAQSYWGTATNGDGDSLVESWPEGVLVWQHLSLAGLVSGTYDGAGAVAAANNSPAGPLSNSFYCSTSDFWPTTPIYLLSPNNHNICIGATDGVTFANGPLFTPQDSYALDIKTDDGLPEVGKTVSARINCADNSGTLAGATYNIDLTTVACYTTFRVR